MSTNLNDLQLFNDHMQEIVAEQTLDPRHCCETAIEVVSSESTLAAELSRIGAPTTTPFGYLSFSTLDSFVIALSTLCASTLVLPQQRVWDSLVSALSSTVHLYPREEVSTLL